MVITIKAYMTQNFLLVQIDEEWHLFYCESTLGCRVIKIWIYANQRTCDITMWTQNAVKSQKMEYL